jgi:hypothetical protein
MRQCAHLDWVVIRDGFVMLSVKLGHDTNVATSLVVDGITEHFLPSSGNFFSNSAFSTRAKPNRSAATGIVAGDIRDDLPQISRCLRR